MNIVRINDWLYTVSIEGKTLAVSLVAGYWYVVQGEKVYSKFSMLDAAFDFIAECDWS